MIFPPIDDLEIQLSTGHGIGIIVEGETYADDPFYYRTWFGDRANEVTFFPQNGWAQVMTAVSELRQRNPDIPVYAIIDRDFCEDHKLDCDFDSLGILRTPRYTLENYLLDPACWAATFQLIFPRNLAAAQGWNQTEFVAQQIKAAYQACCGLAAHNWVVSSITPHYESQPHFQSRNFLQHFKAYSGDGAVSEALLNWQNQLGASEDLPALFQTRLAFLLSQSQEVQATQVSGKYVLKYLHDRFPLKPPRMTKYALNDYLDYYLDKCSSPPPDLVALIDRILAHAHQPKGA